MTKETTVDIAITCYNTGNFIDDCLMSIVTQTYGNWKMIIVDDGSTDNSVDIIRSFIKTNSITSKCKLLSIEKNCGYGTALKAAIEYGTGDIIFVVDSDDAIADNSAISLMVNDHIQNPDVSLIYSNYYDCDVNLSSRSLVQCRNPESGETYLGKFQGNNYMGSYLTISHLKSFKREYYNMTEGLNPNLKKAVDKDLILKLEEVGKIKYLPGNFYLHRRHDKSISTGFKRLPDHERTRIMGMKMGMYLDARDRRRKNENTIR